MESVALFMCLSLIILGACGVVAGVAHLYQDWWDMDGGERCASVIGILCCIGSMAAGFGPWY